MAKIGLLGGTFDPPHIGHLIIADQVLQRMSLDEIRFMPNFLPPHKPLTSGASAEDRLEMIRLAIQGHPNFKIEPIELEREEPSYTYDTMVLLKKREPENEFFFIIGADMVEYLPHWHRIDELVRLVQFIGVNRPGSTLKTGYPILITEVPSIGVSSSEIRAALREGRSVKYLVPDTVLQYIKEKRLYGTR